MSQHQSGKVIQFVPTGERVTGIAATEVPTTHPVAQCGTGRVQIRLALDDIGQAERDLALLRSAADDALRLLHGARRRQDASVLDAVRGLFEATNRRLNAYRRVR